VKDDGEMPWAGIGILFLVFVAIVFVRSCTAEAGVTPLWPEAQPAPPRQAPDEPLLVAYILPTSMEDITVICVSYTADVRRWGERNSPGFCFTQSEYWLLEAVEKQHKKRMDEVEPAGFGGELG